MAASRGQTPPANLKERIAALQQRSVSPNTHQSAQAVPRGLPSPGSGRLRDKIAKFEEKGGTPVPRGSFAMGVPQLAENAPPKKRGELYGNRVPGLGRPSGPPVSRSGSPPATDESVPAPRKRCISTGTGLSNSPSNFSTDEPVPALPNGLTARRNSLAVSFGSGRRVMSTNDADPSTPLPEKPPENVEEQATSTQTTIEPTPSVEPTPTEAPPLPTEDPPAPKKPSSPLYDASQNVSQSSSTIDQDSKDGHSDYQSAPQSAVSQPSPSLPAASPPSPAPADVPFPAPAPTLTPTLAPAETGVISPPTSPPKEVTKPAAACRDSTLTISVPNPMVPIPPSIPTPTPTIETPESKSTFKAVVHRKVTEQPNVSPPSTLAPPVAPPLTRHRRSANNNNVIEVPPSPACGDLAVLLEDAALLELRLTENDGKGLKAKDGLPNTPTPTSTTFQTPRYESASALTEHVHMPSEDSGSQSMRSVSIPSIREPLIDGDIPEGEETDGRSLASTTFSQRSPSHRKYLTNIYRLTGRRSSSYMPGSYPRDSMSVSSEDSSPVTTPSDSGKRKGFGIAWPSGSPKKGGPVVSRSSSFADKIFNRSRTKSNVSSIDQASERNSIYESSQPNLTIQPSLTISFPSELSPDGPPDGVDMGAHQTAWIPPGDTNPEFSPASSVLDKDIFDAFPSVPQTLPPGFHLDAENANTGRASTLPVNGRKSVHQRLSMM